MPYWRQRNNLLLPFLFPHLLSPSSVCRGKIHQSRGKPLFIDVDETYSVRHPRQLLVTNVGSTFSFFEFQAKEQSLIAHARWVEMSLQPTPIPLAAFSNEEKKSFLVGGLLRLALPPPETDRREPDRRW